MLKDPKLKIKWMTMIKQTIIARRPKLNDRCNSYQSIHEVSIFCSLLHFIIFNIGFFPILRTDILSSLKFGDDVIVETKILDCISADVDLLDVVK